MISTVSGFVVPEGAGADAISRLARVTTELVAAESMDDVVTAAVAHGAEAIGAAVTTLMLVQDERVRLVAGRGLSPRVRQQWDSFGLDDANPASEAARTSRPVLVAASAQAADRYPTMRNQLAKGRSIVCLPLGGGRPSLGVLALTFDGGYLPGDRELDLLTAFAGTCGQTIGWIQASERARERAEQLGFLAAASAELARNLDYRQTLGNVARLAVPKLADWCAVHIVQDGVLATVAVAHVDPDKIAQARELQEKYPIDPDSPSGAANVVRTGISELIPELTEQMLEDRTRDPEHLRLVRELELRSAIVVPLPARSRVLGAITLDRAASNRPFEQHDLALAEDLGRRAAVAIDNAMLFEQSKDVALQLQRAVLPEALDDIPGWEVAAHYVPGGDAEVGGDFYDAIALPDGRVTVLIGDVMGHGVQAAAAMAQIRAAVRAYIATDPAPEVVVRKLDNMFRLLGTKHTVTLVYGVIDPETDMLTFVNAGHYPPLIAAPDLPARFVETPPRSPLGAGGDERIAHVVDFRASGRGPMDTLVLYTDGLIERRGEIIDVGLRHLGEAGSALRDGPLRPALAELVAGLRRSEDDDVTAFAVRRRP